MKVGIIGAGLVGSTTAYTLAIEGTVREIVLVDINKVRAEAEADDIIHATAFKQDCTIYEGDYSDLKGADVVIITADGAPNFTASRLELVDGNTKMFKSIIPGLVKYAPDSIIVVTTNPVDVMTMVALQLSGFPKSKVIGSGTVLDTARFRSAPGQISGYFAAVAACPGFRRTWRFCGSVMVFGLCRRYLHRGVCRRNRTSVDVGNKGAYCRGRCTDSVPHLPWQKSHLLRHCRSVEYNLQGCCQKRETGFDSQFLA